jgi:mRNA interferase MazF
LTEPVGRYRHIVVAFVTRRIPAEPLTTDLVLDSSEPDFAWTGLLVSSTLRLHRLMTITTGLIRRELGRLSPKMEAKVKDKLAAL